MISRVLSLPAVTAWALTLFAAAPARAATQLELQGVAGYDSNVFHLNDSIGVRDGMFADLDAGFGIEWEQFARGVVGLDWGAAARLYESGVSDGNEEKYFVRLRGTSGGKRSEHAFDWALRYRVLNSTYVSRFTGVVATDAGGMQIGDRFDSSIGDFRGAWHFPRGDYGRVSVEAAVEAKDYRNDYAALGLDQLDYSQYEVTPEWETGRRTDTLRIRLPLALRQYRDRRASDVNGNPVAGTDLEYTYYGMDARYQHELTRASTLEFSGGYELRHDNGIGYDDRARWNVATEWSYRPEGRVHLSAGLEYSSRVLDRPVTGNPLINDETPDKRGYTANGKYLAPFPGVEVKDLSLLAEMRWESFDNSNDVRFSYDRLEAYAGVLKRF